MNVCAAGYQVGDCQGVGEVVTVMCVHEHVRTGPLCERHRRIGVKCRDCHEHPTRPHKCLLNLAMAVPCMRLVVALTALLTGCAVTTNPPDGPSAVAPGAKRWTAAGATRHHPGKARPRRRPLLSPTSRDLPSRRPIAQPLLSVTMYCETGSRNAAGNWPTVGTAAANAYALGTRLSVEGYGVVTVEDRSAPSATDVDIYGGSDSGCEARALAWGRRLLHVGVLR